MPEVLEGNAHTLDRVLDVEMTLLPRLPPQAQYGVSLLLVLLATAAAFVVQDLITAPNLTLIYVLPVIAAATLFGWGPSLLAVAAGVAAYDFFFTEPYYSFRMTDPSEIWAAVLLLIIGAIVASIAATSRRRATEATEAAARADALQALAHVVVTSSTLNQVLQAAATALHRIFRAPAIVFIEGEPVSDGAFLTAGVAKVTPADEEAARGAASTQIATRGETYPTDRTYFDFWPVSTPAGHGCVLGVDFVHSWSRERPASPEKLVEGVAGYVAAAMTRTDADVIRKSG